MSEIVKSVFVNYIVCAVFGGILEYMAPERTRKMLRTCVVALMLITSVAPVLQVDLSYENIMSAEKTELQEQYNALMHIASITEKKIYAEMKDILIKTEVDEYEIYITTNVDKAENTVYLENIKIEIDEAFEEKIPLIKKQIPEEYKNIFAIGIKNE